MNSTTEDRYSRTLLNRRRAGILLHPTSLPGGDRNGTLGEDAFRFVDLLAKCGISVWQTLPLGPTHDDLSPYQCLSVHAGNPNLIDCQRLVQWGWLDAQSTSERKLWLAQAYAGFSRTATVADRADLETFVQQQSHWLHDYALYLALHRETSGRPWWLWSEALRDREPGALAQARQRLAPQIEQVCFEQFVFFRQWLELRRHAAHNGVLLFGDMPIFVAHDSADVWTHRRYFCLDSDGQPRVVAGVPPDYFSETGQRWGNPLYDWAEMQADGFRWWRERMRTQLMLFDIVRIDHFRGFEAFWEIPAHEPTAVGGRWVAAPGDALFSELRAEFGPLPLVAEDLGLITQEVHALRQKYSLPGMRVLQFAFEGGADNSYLPHHYDRHTVVYTGTHDNDTTVSWYESVSARAQSYVRDYLGRPTDSMPWPLIRAALASVANLAMLPMQDVLALGAGHRMNMPGTSNGNWRWRFGWEQLTTDAVALLHHLVILYGRAAQ